MPQKSKRTLEPEPPEIRVHQVKSRDLNEQLKIDLSNLDHEMETAADRYARWTGLLAEVASRVAKLEEDMERLEAKLFIRYKERHTGAARITDIKYYIVQNSKYQRLHRKLRKWQDSERLLRFAERAFTQRKEMLQSLNANQRKEKNDY